jgi:hypothetical protein
MPGVAGEWSASRRIQIRYVHHFRSLETMRGSRTVRER